MKTEELLAKKREAEKVIGELREQLKKGGGSFLADILKPLFEKYPQVKGVTWSQYTPYFSDGDENIFGVNEIDILVDREPEDEEYGSDSDDELSRFEEVDYKSARYDALKPINEEFTSVVRILTDDDMKSIFGDHVRIMISPDGTIETEEHSHD
jgi:hypothetical protein